MDFEKRNLERKYETLLAEFNEMKNHSEQYNALLETLNTDLREEKAKVVHLEEERRALQDDHDEARREADNLIESNADLKEQIGSLLTQLGEAQSAESFSGHEPMNPVASLSKFDTPSSSTGMLHTGSAADLKSKSSSPEIASLMKSDSRASLHSPVKSESVKRVSLPHLTAVALQETRQQLEAAEKAFALSEKNCENAEKKMELWEREKNALQKEIADLNVRIQEIGKENMDLEEERDNAKEELRIAQSSGPAKELSQSFGTEKIKAVAAAEAKWEHALMEQKVKFEKDKVEFEKQIESMEKAHAKEIKKKEAEVRTAQQVSQAAQSKMTDVQAEKREYEKVQMELEVQHGLVAQLTAKLDEQNGEHEKKHQSLRRELSDAKAEIEMKSSEFDSSQTLLKQVRAEKSSFEKDHENTLWGHQQKIKSLEDDLGSKVRELDNLQTALEFANDELTEARSELAEEKKNVTNAETSASARLSAQQNLVGEQNLTLEKMEREHSVKLRQMETKFWAENNSAQSENVQHKAEIKKLHEQLDWLRKKQSADHKEAIEEKVDKIDALTSDLIDVKQECEDFRNEIKKVKDEKKAAEVAHSDLKQKMEKEMENLADKHNRVVEKLKSDKDNQLRRSSSLNNENQAAIDNLRETHQKEVEEK